MQFLLSRKSWKRFRNEVFSPLILRYIFTNSSIEKLLENMKAENEIGVKRFEKLLEDASAPIIDDRIIDGVIMLKKLKPINKDSECVTLVFPINDTDYLTPYINYIEKIQSYIRTGVDILSKELKRYEKLESAEKSVIEEVNEEIVSFHQLNRRIGIFVKELKVAFNQK
jgi:hypothetical protein